MTPWRLRDLCFVGVPVLVVLTACTLGATYALARWLVRAPWPIAHCEARV